MTVLGTSNPIDYFRNVFVAINTPIIDPIANEIIVIS